MASGPQKSGTHSAAAVATGTVVAVYPESRTIDVEVDLSGESDIHSNLAYGTLYTNVATGTHVDFVPEVGAKCLVLTLSDGSDPVVMGWVSAPRHGSFAKEDEDEPEEDYMGGRLGLAPGDIAMYNARGATVLLRKGGTLQIGASPLAQTVYIPIDNFIRHFFQNYEAKSLLGTLYWKHGAIKTGDEETSAQLYWGMKKDVEDSFVTINVRAGRAGDEQFSPKQEELFGATREQSHLFSGSYPHDPQETTLISVCIDPENTGCTYVFQIDTEGNVFSKITGDIHWEVGSAHIYAAGGFDLKFGSVGRFNAGSDSALEMQVQSLVVKALAGVVLSTSSATAGCTIGFPNINLGKGPVEPAVLGLKLLALLASHEHGPPTPPLGTGKNLSGFPTADWIALLDTALAQSVKIS